MTAASTQTWLTPHQHRQRWIALAALLVVLTIVVVLLHALWWTPWVRERQRATSAAERLARIEAVVKQRPRIESALQAVEQHAHDMPLVMPEPTSEQAVAGLMQRLSLLVGQVGESGKRCVIDSQTPPVAGAAAAGGAGRVAVAAHLRCGNGEWLRLVHAIEAGQPALFIDDLSVNAPSEGPLSARTTGPGWLDINMTVYGYARQTAAAEPRK